MRKKAFLIITLALGAFLPSLSCVSGANTEGKMRVAVSILPQAEFVKAIGGEKVKVLVMVPPGLEPHTYEPKPSQMRELQDVALYVKVGSGLGFELTYLDKLIAVSRKMVVCDSSRGIQLIKSSEEEGLERGTDPHIWLSPLNAKIMAQNIYNSMAELDPASKTFYARNLDAYREKLSLLDRDVREGLAEIQNRRFMVFHPAWGYFARDYNLEEIAIEVGGKEPSAQDMVRLVNTAREHQIKVIFVAPQFSRKSAEFLASEIGGSVISIDQLAPDYVNNMRYVLSELLKAMK